MHSKTHYVAILPNGFEYFYDVDSDRSGRLSDPHTDNAMSAMHEANLTTSRKDPQKIQVKINRLDLVKGQVKRVPTTTITVQLPLARMTEGEYQQELSETLSPLPDDFRGFVSSQAWERGHSAGYEEVIMFASELVYALLPAIDKYTKALKGQR